MIVLSSELLMMISLWTARAFTPTACTLRVHRHSPEGKAFDGVVARAADDLILVDGEGGYIIRMPS